MDISYLTQNNSQLPIFGILEDWTMRVISRFPVLRMGGLWRWIVWFCLLRGGSFDLNVASPHPRMSDVTLRGRVRCIVLSSDITALAFTLWLVGISNVMSPLPRRYRTNQVLQIPSSPSKFSSDSHACHVCSPNGAQFSRKEVSCLVVLHEFSDVDLANDDYEFNA